MTRARIDLEKKTGRNIDLKVIDYNVVKLSITKSDIIKYKTA